MFSSNNFNNNSQDPFKTKMENFSPKSSPRRVQDSSGTLKTKISLGKNPSIVHSGPFYLLKEPPEKSDLTGSTNLISHYGLEHTYNKFNSKKVKEQLSSFLPTLPCVIDGPGEIVTILFLNYLANNIYSVICRTTAPSAVLLRNLRLVEKNLLHLQAFNWLAFVFTQMYL